MTTALAATSRPMYSCVRCASRKVKCDRKSPCGACVKHKVDCVSDSSQTPRVRHRRIKVQTLTDQIRQYESLLREQGVDTSKLPDVVKRQQSYNSKQITTKVPDDAQAPALSPGDCIPGPPLVKAHVIHVQGKSKLVNNPLWSTMVEELHDPEDALGHTENDSTDQEYSGDDMDFVLGIQHETNSKSRHPSPQVMLQLWQTFVENVDPLTKVIHVPTVRKAIEKAATNISVIPKTFEALLFAMYSAAVMSLNDDECRRVLFQPRKVLLSRYVDETRAALSRIKFMGTTSLVVLQALVLHVLSVRDMYEPRALWALTGVAVRIAQSMGLDRDGEYLNLPPFDTEIRRRVWWQLKTHDFRCAELCGIPKFQDLQTSVESPKWPTNVHDDQLYPDMPSRPTDSDSLTDNIIMAIKGELISFTKGRLASFRGQGNNSGHWDARTTGRDTVEIDRSIKEIENRLESKYIRYCDPSQPLQLMAMLMARCSVNIVRFLSHHPRRWPSIAETALTERHWIWQVSLKVMEQQIMLQSNPQLRQFAWHALYFQNWHILIHILDTLRADPLIADAEKAWRLIGNTYESLPELTQDMRKPIHIAIGNLCLEAYGIREAACTMMNAGRPLLVPDFILHLRRQIISIKNRREGRLRKNSVTKNVANSDQMYPASKGLASDSGVANTQVSRSATKLIDHSLEADRSEDNAVDSGVDSFWNTYEIIDANNGNESEAAGFDLDLILDQDSATKDSGSDAIDWVQWDAWLAESNVLGPFEGEGDLF